MLRVEIRESMVPVVYREEEVGMSDFVSFWSSVYTNNDEDDIRPDSSFLRHLRWPDGVLRAPDIDFLFQWKNGMPLSAKKQVVTARVRGRLDALNRMRGSGPEKLLPLAEKCTK